MMRPHTTRLVVLPRRLQNVRPQVRHKSLMREPWRLFMKPWRMIARGRAWACEGQSGKGQRRRGRGVMRVTATSPSGSLDPGHASQG
jgi:hypothetical protein